MARGKQKKSNGSELGYEAKLWQMADALRNNMDAAESKHVVLGLICFRSVSKHSATGCSMTPSSARGGS